MLFVVIIHSFLCQSTQQVHAEASGCAGQVNDESKFRLDLQTTRGFLPIQRP